MTTTVSVTVASSDPVVLTPDLNSTIQAARAYLVTLNQLLAQGLSYEQSAQGSAQQAAAYADQAAGAATQALAMVRHRTSVNDQSYAILTSDVFVVLTACSASRTFTLPSAANFSPLSTLVVWDESGALASGRTLTIAASGTDTIAGSASVALATPYQTVVLHSNGSGLWTYK